MSDEAIEVHPVEFFTDDDEGDFRPIEREEPDPKAESAQEYASFSDLIPTLESEESVTVERGTSQHKADESSTATLSQGTKPGESEPPAQEKDQSSEETKIPGSPSEGKPSSPTPPRRSA